jgi:rhodanese-related sulfurtransferase
LPPATIDRGSRPYQDVAPTEAERLLAEGATVLDVRSPREYEELGHIPGALLLPVELAVSGPAVLPQNGRPVLVICQHGARSRQAAALLAEAGVVSVYNVTGGMSRWTGPRESGKAEVTGPSSWLLSNALVAPRGARTLDVACGRGRHALLLASVGFPVRAVDRDADGIVALERVARRLRLPLETAVLDLEAGSQAANGGVLLGDEEWEMILVFNYLHRPLFPALVRALKPGGVLLYETFTREEVRRGRPTSPEHLLELGELPGLVAPLAVVRRREGEFDGRYVASVVARKPALAPRRMAASHTADAAKVPATPRTQRRPAARAASASRGRGKRTPGARKR